MRRDRRGGDGGGRAAGAAVAGRRPPGGRVLRPRRGRQDHGVGRHRPAGGPGRAGGPAWSPSTRPGGWPTRSGVESLHQRPGRGAGATGRAHLARAHARHQGHLRRPGRPLRPDPRTGRGHPANRIYQNLTGAAVGHPGVHGDGEALRADRGGRLRHRGGGHARRPATPSTCSTRPAGSPASSRTACSGPCSCPTRAYLRALSVATQALLRTISKVAGAEIVQDAVTFFQAFAGHGGGLPHPGRGPSASCWPTRPPPTCWSPRPGPTPSRRPPTSPTGWPTPGSTPAALVVNRVHPHFGPRADADAEAPAGSDLAALVEQPRAGSSGIADERRRATPTWSSGWRPAPVGPDAAAADRRPRPRRPGRGGRPPSAPPPWRIGPGRPTRAGGVG